MSEKKEVKPFIAFGLLIFLGLMLFFTVINPLVVYDADDWLYIYEIRKPIPMLHVWNPTKVFPETSMPFVSYVGALVINPIVNNYCRSLTIAHSIFASMIITIYFVQFAVMFYKRKFASAKASIGYGCLFILLHFIALILSGKYNDFFLGATNLTCFYNYTLAAIINGVLVMHFMSYGGVKAWYNSSNVFHKILVLLWMYFCLNSNLYSSVVLATYVGTELFLNLANDIKEKSFNLKAYLVSNWQNLFIIIWWLSTNLLELTGGRADSMGKSLIGNMPRTLGYVVAGVVCVNVFVFAVEAITFFKWYNKHDKKPNATAKRFMYYIGFQLVYLILLSAKVEPWYIFRCEVKICTFFYIFIAFIACLSELVKDNKKYIRVLYVLAGTLVLLFIKPGGPVLNPYNYTGISYKQCEAVMNDMIEQFKTAEEQGKTEMVLEVPKFDSDDNWPFTDYMGERVANALYRHHIVNTYLQVKEVTFSEEMNEKYGISSSNE